MRIDLVVLGTSGHAREIEALARAVEPASERWGEIRLVGPEDEAGPLQEAPALVVGFGSPAGRLRLLANCHPDDGRWPRLVHPSASVDASASLGDGVTVQVGAVVTTDVRIGPLSHVQYNVSIGHDAVVGAGCLLNPGSIISGNVTIGNGVLIGAGAVVLERLRIGEGAVVGAGAVVTHDVPAGVTVVGVPARALGGGGA